MWRRNQRVRKESCNNNERVFWLRGDTGETNEWTAMTVAMQTRSHLTRNVLKQRFGGGAWGRGYTRAKGPSY